MRPVAARGGRTWGLAGLAVAALPAIPGGWLITAAGVDHGQAPQRTVTRVVTVPQPVTTLNVQSYGAPVQVTAGPVHRVQITETISYNPQVGGLPGHGAGAGRCHGNRLEIRLEQVGGAEGGVQVVV